MTDKNENKDWSDSDSSDSDSSDSDSSSDSLSSSSSSETKSVKSHNSCCDKKCFCGKLLYSIGSWADNRVTKIKFIPQAGIPIVWTAPITLIQSSPTNTNHWNMQSPITQASFPIFPLKINCGDKLEFTFDNDLLTPNAFACSVNIDGIIYRTSNSTNAFYLNKINLNAVAGFSIIDPLYSPTTDIITRNIVDTINYISVSPNTVSSYTLTWIL
jgi:hypothetical protein